jgi:uncharacterized protein (TIGR00255 family)
MAINPLKPLAFFAGQIYFLLALSLKRFHDLPATANGRNMANRSMTGFGMAEGTTPAATYRVEIRSVNNRYQEIQVRTPRSLAVLEPRIKKAISECVSRGTITVTIASDCDTDPDKPGWDKGVVESYIGLFREIKKAYELAGDITVSDLVHLSNIIKIEPSAGDETVLWKRIRPALNGALAVFQKSREDEARCIIKDLQNKTLGISRALDKITKLCPGRIKRYAVKLNRQIRALGADPNVDPQRCATEIALMADRLDISEECTRLRAHLQQLAIAFGANTPVGKKMNFILQEMNREANTIASKANDAAIAHLAISIKENIEKIREQVQNLE